MYKDKKIVVVMPAYNAEKTLERTYHELDFNLVDELIFVDDNSPDNTLEVAAGLGIRHIFRHDVNKGYGGNQKTCYDQALALGADIIVMLHPDYQYTPKLIPAMVSLIGSGLYEVVFASRILGKGAVRGGMPAYKYLFNRILTFIQNLLMNQKMSEYHTGFRAYTRKVLEGVNYHGNSDDYIFDNEIVAQIFARGHEIAEITCPTVYNDEASSINFLRSIKYGAGVVRVSFRYFLHRAGIVRWKQLAILLVFLVATLRGVGQVSSDAAVRLTATIDTTVPSITINWPLDTLATAYTVYKKAKTSTTWTEIYDPLPGSFTGFSDHLVAADSNYEYGVEKSLPTLTAYGYINAGWNIHAAGYRGRLLLLVDSTLADSLKTEILRLMGDISGDGWSVVRYDVPRTMPVPDVRAIVVNEYNSDPADTRALLILGHVPVPYSGDLNPDGHPDHKGAWPADIYYADVNGNFTDQYVNDPNASRTENQNIPGDGKFDQSIIPSPVELQTGRVDLSNLPAFPYTEIALMRRYLDKDHAFRNKLITAQPRALISDNFGFFGGEAFAADGWRNFAPLLGTNSMAELPYFTTLAHESYLWSYGCGGGWYQGAGGVGTTADFAADTVQTIFSMMFGSYFGDWDNADNFLRAPLASADRALTNCWAGRPFWQFHHMALGETVGYGAQLAQNNQVTYAYNYGRRFVHIALMGDPTLRMHIITPASGVSATAFGPDVNLVWQPTPDTVLGYHVYRATQFFGRYERLTTAPVAALTFTDHQPVSGMNYYMVRPVKLEQTPSGSYYNQGIGATDSVNFIVGLNPTPLVSAFDFTISPNPTAGRFRVTFSHEIPVDFSLSLSDPMGKLLFRHDYSLSPMQNSVTVDPGNLVNGVYLVTVRAGERKMVKRLQVVR